MNQTTGTTSQLQRKISTRHRNTRLINCPPPLFTLSLLHMWEMFHLSPPPLLCFVRLALLSLPLFFLLSVLQCLPCCLLDSPFALSLLHQSLKLAFTPAKWSRVFEETGSFKVAQTALVWTPLVLSEHWWIDVLHSSFNPHPRLNRPRWKLFKKHPSLHQVQHERKKLYPVNFEVKLVISSQSSALISPPADLDSG